MIKSKYKKIFIICFLIVFAIMSVITSINEGDLFHTEHCTKHDCSICSLINLSTIFIRSIGIANIFFCLNFLVIAKFNEIYKKIKRIRKYTLIDLKVVNQN